MGEAVLDVTVTRWDGADRRAREELEALLAAYHAQTEAEKGRPVAVDALPERYRAEIADPRVAFADDVVLIARHGDDAAGCLVITTAADGSAEVKRLWTDPAHRGRGIASALLDEAFAEAARAGAPAVRLSVWQWREDAIGLYRKLGFTVTESWEAREQLVCMTRPV